DIDYHGVAPWQNMAYKHQLYYKQKEVENNLKRIGKLNLPEISPIIGSAKTRYYRNEMEYTFSNSRWFTEEEINSNKDFDEVDRNALGFHVPGRWDKVINITSCHLQKEPSNTIRNEIREFALQNSLSFFDLRKQEGFLRTLMIRTSTTGELMVLLQFFYEDREQRELLLDHIANKFPEITALLYVINEKQNETIYDQEVICYRGKDHI